MKDANTYGIFLSKIAMLISRIYEPKRLAVLSAGIGVLAGVVYGMQSIFQVFSPIVFERIVFSLFSIGISMLFPVYCLRSLALLWGLLPGCTKRGVFFSLSYRKQLLAGREA